MIVAACAVVLDLLELDACSGNVGVVFFSGLNGMVMSAVFFPCWDGDRYVVSCDERVADSGSVAYGQGSGAGEIAAWLEGDFGCLGRGSEQRTRGSFDAVASDAKGGSCVHFGEGHVVLRVRDLFLVFSRWNRNNVALLNKAQIVSVLDLYASFRSVNPRRRERPPAPFEFEFEAEGDDAIRRFVDAGGDVARLKDGFSA
ncbi:TPA: hypothetical protein QEL15_000973 [Stenotrophomonas maltophilia]|nr:hypothetical protein [Stenotrophomonas maltophilia]